MRLHVGAIPENAEFEPEAQGWTGLREPSPAMFQVWAVPVAVFNVVLLALLWNLTKSSTTTQPHLVGLGMIVVLVAFIPIHELLHACAAPGGCRSEKTIIGVWPQRMLFYAHHNGAMPRNRFLLVFFLPFLVLSLLPIPVAGLWTHFTDDGTLAMILQGLSFINGVAACGDILGITMIWKQVPAKALVRNQGWRTYWKITDEESS